MRFSTDSTRDHHIIEDANVRTAAGDAVYVTTKLVALTGVVWHHMHIRRTHWVLTPFADVPQHVEQAQVVWLQRPDRRRPAGAARLGVAVPPSVLADQCRVGFAARPVRPGAGSAS